MSSAAPVSRPGGVTLVVIFMWIAGILEILAGLVYVWLSFNPAQIPNTLSTQDALQAITATDDLKSFLLWGGIVGIVLGLITILLANGLKNGSNGVRIFVTILIVLQILSDAWEITQLRGNAVYGNLLAILLWLIALGLLWSSRSSAFFKQSR